MDFGFTTLAGLTLVTALRAAILALVAVAAAVQGAQMMRLSRPYVSDAGLWMMLMVLLTPGIVVGYHSAVSRSGASPLWGTEAAYSFMVLMRVAPLAVLLLWLSPPRVTESRAHAFRMMSQLPMSARWRWKLRGWCGELWPVFCVIFLVVFQEFDLAACLNARSWTIALFDAQAGGQGLGQSLRMMAFPLALECLVIGALALRGFTMNRESHELPPRGREAAWSLLASLAGVFIFPFAGLFLALRDGWAGLPALRENFALGPEVANSFTLALVASIAAWLLSAWALASRTRRIALGLPGLLGGMVVSLSLLALFQLPPLYFLRASPLPLIIALVLVLMPAALFIRALLARAADTEAAHLATLADARPVRWRLTKRPALWGGALLFLQAYGDFTANSLLAPPALTSAFSRIFNLMHYGRTTALTSMLLITLAVPLLALLLTAFIVRTYAHRRDS